MATDMFIKFDDVEGEATETDHDTWIEILSWNHGFSQPASPLRDSTGSTIERANHSDLTITKYMDKATRRLLKDHWGGNQYEEVTIDCLRASGDASILYLQIIMNDVIISNYNISGGGGDIPIENLSLSYSKVSYQYDSKKKEDGQAEGVQKVYHDLKTSEIGE